MKKATKKALAFLLLTAMILSVFSACNTGENSSKNADTSSGKGSAAPETNTEGKINNLMYAEGLPLVDEDTFTFSIFVDDSSSTGEFWMLNELEKQTNVKVDLRIYPYETATERLNLDLNSGDYADVIGGWTLSDSMILTYGVDQGVFIPLEDYYAEYCPRITEMLDLEGVREDMTAPDGHIYGIPYVTGDTTVNYSPYINSRWLETVKMEMPTTTEEFEAVLMAFKEQDANGNGDTSDEIPFSSDPNNLSLESMAGWFGMPMEKNGFAIYENKTVYAGVSPQYREFLSWFNKLYEKGLVDQEIFTQDSSTWEGKGNNDLYGVSIAYGSSEYSGEETKEEKGKYDHLPVLNADNGGTWLRATTGHSVYRTQAVITDNCTNPEIVTRWFDNAFALENGIGCTSGPVGVVVMKEENGEYRSIDKSTLPEDQQEALAWGNLWPQALPKYVPEDFEITPDVKLYDEKKALEEGYEPFLTKETIDKFWVSLEDVDEYSELTNAISNYYREQKARFISGELDIDDDAHWNSYVSYMKSIGLEEWVKMRSVETIVE